MEFVFYVSGLQLLRKIFIPRLDGCFLGGKDLVNYAHIQVADKSCTWMSGRRCMNMRRVFLLLVLQPISKYINKLYSSQENDSNVYFYLFWVAVISKILLPQQIDNIQNNVHR